MANPNWVKGMAPANPKGRPAGKVSIKKCKEILAEQGINPIEELIKIFKADSTTAKEKITILFELQSYAESKPVKEVHSINENVNQSKEEYLKGLPTEELIKLLNTVDKNDSVKSISNDAPIINPDAQS